MASLPMLAGEEAGGMLQESASDSEAGDLVVPPTRPPVPLLRRFRREWACMALAGLAGLAVGVLLNPPSSSQPSASARLGSESGVTQLWPWDPPSGFNEDHAPTPAPGGQWIFQPLDDDGNPTCQCACADLWTTVTTTTTVTTVTTTTVTTTTVTTTTATTTTLTTLTTTTKTTTTATKTTTVTTTTVTTTTATTLTTLTTTTLTTTTKTTTTATTTTTTITTTTETATTTTATTTALAERARGGPGVVDAIESIFGGGGHAPAPASHGRSPAEPAADGKQAEAPARAPAREGTRQTSFPAAERCLELPERLMYCRSHNGHQKPLCIGIKGGDEGVAAGILELQTCAVGDASRHEQFVLNHTDSQIHWFQDPSKCLAVEVSGRRLDGTGGKVEWGARVKLEDCQDPCEVRRDPTRQGFCVDIMEGEHKVIKSSCYGEASPENPAKFDTNRETVNTGCLEVAGGASRIGAPVQVAACNEREWHNRQCWQYIDLYRKCASCAPKSVPSFMNLKSDVLPMGGTDCMANAFPGGCAASYNSYNFEGCGKGCCCDGHAWTCERDSFTCGCWRPQLQC